MIDLISTIKLAKDLNLIQQVHWKLVRQNELAAEKQTELAKMVGTLDDEIVRCFSLRAMQAEFIA